ncbi:MAG: hypothetical protein AAF828_10670, partial [Bacteroidota bacterium]
MSITLRLCITSLFMGFVLPSLPAQSLRFQEYGVDEGLPERTVSDVLIGPSGFRWIGNNGGLCRFDGNRFLAFPNPLPPDYRGQQFNGKLFLDHHHRIIAQVVPGSDSLEIFNLLDYKVASYSSTASQATLAGAFVHFFHRKGAPLYQLRRTERTAYVYRFEQNMQWRLMYQLVQAAP